MFNNNKNNLANITLIIMAIFISILSIILISLPYLKKEKIDTNTNGMNNLPINYNSNVNNKWDISATENDNVIATLSADGTLIISGIGEMKQVADEFIPYDEIKNIKSIIIQAGVTNISDYSFQDFENLVTVVIPSTVVSIGEFTFSWCKSLDNIEIPSSVISIGYGAFDECSSCDKYRT